MRYRPLLHLRGGDCEQKYAGLGSCCRVANVAYSVVDRCGGLVVIRAGCRRADDRGGRIIQSTRCGGGSLAITTKTGVLMLVNTGLFSGESDEWSTPADLYAVLDREFGFDLDVCATAGNAKTADYFTLANSGLDQPWAGRRCFMNPPYSKIGAWMDKAYREALAGALVVCLVPARTDTRWFWASAQPAQVRFLPGRLKFGNGKNSAPFPSAVVVMYPGLPAMFRGCHFWDWRLLSGETTNAGKRLRTAAGIAQPAGAA